MNREAETGPVMIDPFTRSISREAEARGHVKGHVKGRAEGYEKGRREGHEEGRAAGHVEAVFAMLGARGIGSASRFAQERGLLANLPLETSMAVATVCSDKADFRRRLREASPWEGPGL